MAKTFYEILGLNQDCTKAQIEKKFRELSLKHHSDRIGEVGKEIFQEITTAREILRDKDHRRIYDNALNQGHEYAHDLVKKRIMSDSHKKIDEEENAIKKNQQFEKNIIKIKHNLDQLSDKYELNQKFGQDFKKKFKSFKEKYLSSSPENGEPKPKLEFKNVIVNAPRTISDFIINRIIKFPINHPYIFVGLVTSTCTLALGAPQIIKHTGLPINLPPFFANLGSNVYNFITNNSKIVPESSESLRKKVTNYLAPHFVNASSSLGLAGSKIVQFTSDYILTPTNNLITKMTVQVKLPKFTELPQAKNWANYLTNNVNDFCQYILLNSKPIFTKLSSLSAEHIIKPAGKFQDFISPYASQAISFLGKAIVSTKVYLDDCAKAFEKTGYAGYTAGVLSGVVLKTGFDSRAKIFSTSKNCATYCIDKLKTCFNSLSETCGILYNRNPNSKERKFVPLNVREQHEEGKLSGIYHSAASKISDCFKHCRSKKSFADTLKRAPAAYSMSKF